MRQLVQFLYSGLVLGSIFSAMAVGLALVWGALRMLNMAHGSMIMLGAYVAFVATVQWHLHALVGLVVAVLAVALLGALLYPLVVRPLIGKEGWEVNAIIATVGLSIALSQAVQLIFGPKSKALPPILSGGFLGPDRVFIDYQSLLIAAAALLSLGLTGAFLYRTRYGIALRAVAQNLEGAQLMGLPIGRVYLLILALSAGLAALSGVLLSSGFLFLEPSMGLDPMLKALVIVILGGLGSIRGTLYAAYAAGLVNSGVESYIGPQWALPALFLVVIVVLLLRPSGLLGRSLRSA
jgi:branched-chain amino acid transport system permease protein